MLPEKILRYLHAMQLKCGEILIFTTFLAKRSFFAYISLKIGYFELGDEYEVTVTSYVRCWYLFLVYMERGDPSYTTVPILKMYGGSFSSSQGVITISRPLGKTCYKKGLVLRQG